MSGPTSELLKYVERTLLLLLPVALRPRPTPPLLRVLRPPRHHSRDSSPTTPTHELAPPRYLRSRGPPHPAMGEVAEDDGAFSQTRAAAPEGRELGMLVRDAGASGKLRVVGRALADGIPPAVFDVAAKLTSLELSDASLPCLDGGILQWCTALAHLKVDGNGLTNLPEALRELPLVSLDLSNNHLSAHAFADLALGTDPSDPRPACALGGALKRLDVSKNRLERVPEAFQGLRRLEELDVCYNPLASLGGVAWQVLASLTKLDASNCAVAHLGDVLPNTTTLKTLALDNNALTRIPPSLARMPLRSLTIAGNPQRGLRTSVVAGGTSAIVAALRNQLPMDAELRSEEVYGVRRERRA